MAQKYVAAILLTAVALLMIMIRVAVAASDTRLVLGNLCPYNCSCNDTEFHQLSINCSNRKVVIEENPANDSLSDEINHLLRNPRMKELRSLAINNCEGLTLVPSGICDAVHVKMLNLDRNKIEDLPDDCFVRLAALQSLSAENNLIHHLQDGLFDGLQELQEINLSHNKIESIGLQLFTNISDLRNLKKIYLGNNLLTTVEPWPLIRAAAVPTVSIGLDSNLIANFTNSLGWNFNCSSPLLKMNLNLFGNKIDHLINIFEGLRFALFRDVLCFFRQTTQNAWFLEYNPVICDCLDYEYYSFTSRFPFSGQTELLNLLTCELTSGVHKLAVDVQLEDLYCDVIDGCQEDCTCRNHPSDGSIQVLCPNSGLKIAPLLVPTLNVTRTLLLEPAKRYKLDFSGNQLSKLDWRPYFIDTFYMDASNSLLTSITEEALMGLENAETIYLHDNLLTVLPISVRNNSYKFIKSLRLDNNPWACVCENAWMRSWLESLNNSEHLMNPNAIHCHSPERYKGRSVFSMSRDDFCYVPRFEQLATVVVSTMFGCFTAFFLSLLTAFRLRFALFSKWNLHPFDRDECEGENMEYDAFLMYAYEDIRTARELLEILEQNGCKTCFPDRDFDLGGINIDNYVHAVNSSKRVVCVLSGHFVASQYGLLVFNIAEQRHIEIKRKRLVLIRLKEFELPSETVELRKSVESSLVASVLSSSADDETRTPNRIGSDFPSNLVSNSAHGEPSEPKRATSMTSPNSATSTGGELSVSSISLRSYLNREEHVDVNDPLWLDRLLYAMPVIRMGAHESALEHGCSSGRPLDEGGEGDSLLNPSDSNAEDDQRCLLEDL